MFWKGFLGNNNMFLLEADDHREAVRKAINEFGDFKGMVSISQKKAEKIMKEQGHKLDDLKED